MRGFYRSILFAGLSFVTVGALTSSAQTAKTDKKDGPKADKDAAPIAGAKQVGRFAIGIAMNMDLASTSVGPRILGLDGVFAARRTWAVWDGGTGKSLARLTNYRATLTGDECTPAISPDGTKLVLIYRWQVSMFSPPSDVVNTVVYDVKSGKTVVDDRRRGPVKGAVYTPKGALLLFDADSCNVMDPGKTKFTRKFQLAAPLAGAVAVSADDGRLALYAQGTLHVYNLAEGKLDFEHVADAKPKKDNKQKLPGAFGDKFPGLVIGGTGDSATLAFSNSTSDPKLLIYESTTSVDQGGDPKAFAINLTSQGQLRLIDLKEKKQVNALKLPKDVGCIRPYFTGDGEARALTSAPILEPQVPAKEPAKQPAKKPQPQPKQPFPKGPTPLDTLNVFGPAQKMKFQIINLSGTALHEFTLTNPPLLIPHAPSCMLTADGRYLLAITTSAQQQQKSSCMATVWQLKAEK